MNYKNEKIRLISLLTAAMTFTALAAGCSKEAPASSSEESGSSASEVQEKTTAAPATTAVTEKSAAEKTVTKVTKSAVSDLFSERDLTQEYDEPTAKITLSGDSVKTEGSGVSAKGSVVTITEEGIYLISGKLNNGQIVVSADKAKVQLVLDNADITCNDGPAIYGMDSDKIFVTLAKDSKNSLTDGETYADTSEEAPDACIYSKDSLTLNGLGQLAINGRNSCGIHSSDDVVVTGGTINITSVSHGIKAKDYFAAAGGELEITSGGDGIKSTNAEEEGMGFVYIEDGSFTVNAQLDGIQAETDLTVTGGIFDIISGGGSENSTKTHTEEFGGMGGDHGGFGGGMQRPEDGGFDPSQFGGQMPEGDFDPSQFGAPGEMAPPGDMGGEPPEGLAETPADSAVTETMELPAESTPETAQTAETTDNTTSTKGLKAGGELNISGGTFKVNAADDTIHSNANVTISGGNIEAEAGDDGIHAEGNVNISGSAKLNITKSYEGIEAAVIAVSGGDVKVIASDDGFNASDGTSQGGMGTYTEGALVEISGGTVYVSSDGDGLDSNGDINISGGTVFVDGPTNSGNGALDSNGSINVTGGTVAAAGMSGMAEAPGGDSTQYSVSCTFTSTYDGGTEVTLVDQNGSQIMSFTPSKSFNNIVFSSPDIQSGSSYTISTGSEENSFTAGDITTFIGQQSPMGGGMMGGGPGERRGFGGEAPQI